MLQNSTLPITNLIVKTHVIELLTQYSWILLIILAIDLFSIWRTLSKKKKQKDEENDITNLFLDDGSKNEHLSHKEYDVTTKLFIAFILGFFYIALKTL